MVPKAASAAAWQVQSTAFFPTYSRNFPARFLVFTAIPSRFCSY